MGALIHTLCIITIFSTLTATFLAEPRSSSKTVKGGYYPSWDNSPSSVNTSLYTHIFYAFLIPDNATFQFNIDETIATSLKKFTSVLRAKKPSVQTLFSIGGGNVGADLFSRMASSKLSRAAFISSSIEVARKYVIDGMDLDWEFPENSKDMENLDQLLKEWRIEVQKESKIKRMPPLLITAAVYYSANAFLSGAQRAYPVSSIKKNLDWVNVMNYDYHGGWDTSVTGAHAALYDPKSNLSTNFGIKSWIRAGVPGNKLVMGMPLYARTWKLKDLKIRGVGAPAVDVGPGKDGTLTYADVVKFNNEHKVDGVFDSETVSMYSVSGTSWIGYDGVKSITLKIGFARALELRGYFFWQVLGDYKGIISETASELW